MVKLEKGERFLGALLLERDKEAQFSFSNIKDISDKIQGDFICTEIPEGFYAVMIIKVTKKSTGREKYLNVIDKEADVYKRQLPGQAVTLAITTVIARCVGAGDYKQAEFFTRKLVGITYGSLLLVNLAVFPFIPSILSVYHLSLQTAETARPVSYTHLDVYKRQGTLFSILD